MAPPRVSEILQYFGFGQAWGSPYHLARGQAIHRAIQLDLAGRLDEGTVVADIAEGFAAWQKFRAMVPLTVLSAERELTDPVWQFAGHPDLIAVINGLTTLLDYKFTESPDLFYAKHQLAAYRHLWDTVMPDRPILDMAVLQLRPNGGGFRLHPVPKDEWLDLHHTVLSAVRVWHALGDRRRP